jgi:hypothetical protein
LGPEFAGLEGNDLQNLLMSEQHLQMLLGGFMPVNSPSSNRSSSSLSSGTSRVQSTVPGSRADAVSASNSNVVPTTPAAAESAQISHDELTKAPTKKTTNANGGGGGGTATAVGVDQTPSNGTKMQFTDFQNILGNIAQGDYASGRAEVDLSEIVSLDIMAPILANKSIQEKLIKFLPDSEILPKNEAELRKHLTTPQFKKVRFTIKLIKE